MPFVEKEGRVDPPPHCPLAIPEWLLHPRQDHTGCLHPHEEIREVLQVGKGESKRHVQETNRHHLDENLTTRKTNPL